MRFILILVTCISVAFDFYVQQQLLHSAFLLGFQTCINAPWLLRVPVCVSNAFLVQTATCAICYIL